MKKIEHLECFIECSQGVLPKVSTIKRYISYISKMGYDTLYLGLADAYKIKEEPYFNYNRGGYTKEELNEIDEYAKSQNVEVIGQIHTLSHLHFLRKYPEYSEIFDTASNLMVGEERVYELAEHMIKAISEGLSSRKIHLGLDEAFGLGSGNYLKKYGPCDKKELLLRHLNRVEKIAKKYNMSIELWGDMLVEKENTSITPEMVKDKLPIDAHVILWNYIPAPKEEYVKMINDMKQYTDRMSFAGCVWKHIGFAPNTEYSLSALLPQIDACNETNIERFMVTMWSDQAAPTSIFACLPALFVVSEYNNGTYNGKNNLNKKKFKEIVGVDYDDLYSLEYINYPLMEKHKSPSTSAFWNFFNDILFGNFDLYLPDDIDKSYDKLRRKYHKMQNNDFVEEFDKAEKLMNVLKIKSPLNKKIRKAYKENNKDELSLLLKELDKLKKAIQKYMESFERSYLKDNRAFGIELHHIDFGSTITRIEYAKNRIIDYIYNDVKIDELEQEVMKINFYPPVTVSNSIMVDYRYLLSYCIE